MGDNAEAGGTGGWGALLPWLCYVTHMRAGHTVIAGPSMSTLATQRAGLIRRGAGGARFGSATRAWRQWQQAAMWRSETRAIGAAIGTVDGTLL